MARDPITLASRIARGVGSPRTANTIMRSAKDLRRWAKGLPKEAQRQFNFLMQPASAGQKQIANAGSKTRAATRKGQRGFAYGIGTSALMSELFGDAEEKTPAQLERKLSSVYNKVSRTADKGSSEKAMSDYESRRAAVKAKRKQDAKKETADTPKRERKPISVKPDSKKDPMSSSVDALNQKALSKAKKPADKPKAKPAAASKKAKESMTTSMGRAYDKSLMDRMTKKEAPAAKAKPTAPAKAESKPKRKLSAFQQAFADARAKGQKTFKFTKRDGTTETYHTRRQDEDLSAEKMYKGGYKKKTKKATGGMLNGKKPRTGSMDYRKGGLFR